MLRQAQKHLRSNEKGRQYSRPLLRVSHQTHAHVSSFGMSLRIAHRRLVLFLSVHFLRLLHGFHSLQMHVNSGCVPAGMSRHHRRDGRAEILVRPKQTKRSASSPRRRAAAISRNPSQWVSTRPCSSWFLLARFHRSQTSQPNYPKKNAPRGGYRRGARVRRRMLVLVYLRYFS